MKINFFLFLLCFCLVSFSQVEAQGSPYIFNPAEQVSVLASSGLNVRSQTDPSATVLGSLAYGSKVTIVKCSFISLSMTDFGGYPLDDYWYEIEYKGKKGFVYGAYLTRFPPPSRRESEVSDLERYVTDNFQQIASIPLYHRKRE